MPPKFLILLCTIGLASAADPVVHPAFSPEQVAFYEKNVQPILVENCYKCHGGGEPNADGHVKVKSGLQIISRLGLVRGGEHGSAFNATKPLESLLLKAVSYDDDHLKMPPSGKLSDKDRKVLQDWAEMGLPWTVAEQDRLVDAAEDLGKRKEGPDNTWTYEPLREITPPKVAGTTNPIDAFLLTKLQEKKLSFSPPASKAALARRAFYDLTGLPPSPEKAAAFVSDSDPQAYAKLVQQLLSSKQYGEKYARYWLDLVRYAETNGFERDAFKSEIWRYRQWVIDSLNADKPYDDFVREQIAGDELDNVSPDTLLGTGYWNLMQWDDEPADRLQHSYDVMDDNVRITSEAFLGASLGCARCHNHKVDPISQKDYYSFMAFMHGLTPYSADARLRDLSQPEQRLTKQGKQNAQLPNPNERTYGQLVDSQLVKFQKEARKRFAEQKQVPAPADLGKVLLADSREKPTDWHYTMTAPAAHWSTPGYNPDEHGWKQGPGGFGVKGAPGSQVRTDWKTREIWLRGYFQLTSIPKAINLTIHHDEDAEIYLNGRMVKQLRGFLRDYITIPLDADAISSLQTGKNVLSIHVLHTGGGQYVDAGLEVGDPDIVKLLEERGSEVCQPQELAQYQALVKRMPKLAAPATEAPGGIKAQIAVEQGPKPPDLSVHVRGNAHVLGDKVEPAFPVIFKASTPDIRSTERSSGRRKALADWLTNARNPRTARVIVNRVWQWHFGRGLNPSSSEWGKLGGGASHPELIDWLASDFIAHDWSLKYLHTLIMTSQAYQQSAQYSQKQSAAHQADPANILWWRFDMRRLSSEEIRDSVLTVSGNLNPTYGGESFFAELPAEVIATASQGAGAWGKSPPDQLTRRSIYMKSKRSLSNPLMTDFDQADTDNPCPVRFATTVPTQALNFLNSKFLNDQAAVLAQRLSTEHANNLTAQITRGLTLVTQRASTPTEIAELTKLHETFRTQHGTTPEKALERVCLVLLNLNEFLYLD
jgi:hypothetical protein